MKKVFSLILAVAMVLSLASVAFAAAIGSATKWDVKSSSSVSADEYAAVARYDNTVFYTYDSDDHVFTPQSATNTTTYGKNVYFPLLATVTDWAVVADEKSVSSLTLSYVIEEGASFVDSIKIVKKFGCLTTTDAKGNEVGQITDYAKVKDGTLTLTDATNPAKKFNAYYIQVATKGSNTGSKYVSGVINLSGKTGTAKLKDEAIHFDIKLQWPSLNTETDGTSKTPAIKLIDGTKTYVFEAKTAGEYKFANVTPTNKADFTYTVDMLESEKVTLKYDDDEVEAIVDANEEAGISFFNFNGASFKRAGTFLVPADTDEEDVYFYEVLADGSLKNLTSCYDEEEGAFSLKVKKLNQYCISDLPLVDAEGTVAAAPGAVNPVTGAIA